MAGEAFATDGHQPEDRAHNRLRPVLSGPLRRRHLAMTTPVTEGAAAGQRLLQREPADRGLSPCGTRGFVRRPHRPYSRRLGRRLPVLTVACHFSSSHYLPYQMGYYCRERLCSTNNPQPGAQIRLASRIVHSDALRPAQSWPVLASRNGTRPCASSGESGSDPAIGAGRCQVKIKGNMKLSCATLG